MSAQLIIECLKKLDQVHQSFHELAKEKTNVIIKGDISHFRMILQKETSQLKKLQQLEQERSRLVRYFLNGKGLAIESGTITELLPYISDMEKKELLELQKRLVAEIQSLKQTNDLNQQLIQDSLRFVNLSLDVLQPELETGNYNRVKNNESEPLGRSLFDSKA
ncbi:flagellar protein FlgN [Anaerobacillus sp. CMMVII]|uniref:flagellar protein FlgN n=1 Tax=Anaerobacillus sp. CMMVII TaxID=2755588 RepID=UPI0021B7857B|nr:flagellar protein FlgN [Anaerobacillus sp. CMMVII]MCT8140145.1 flagellar protein FlgN [Anaerobacillus sp. CMMVII]